jgi:hypothetical protein
MMAAAVFDINGDGRGQVKEDDNIEYGGGNHGNASEEEKEEEQSQAQEEKQVTKIYGISKIYPDPKIEKVDGMIRITTSFIPGHREKQTAIATTLEKKITHLTLRC